MALWTQFDPYSAQNLVKVESQLDSTPLKCFNRFIFSILITASINGKPDWDREVGTEAKNFGKVAAPLCS